jgi:hypothetical protein
MSLEDFFSKDKLLYVFREEMTWGIKMRSKQMKLFTLFMNTIAPSIS